METVSGEVYFSPLNDILAHNSEHNGSDLEWSWLFQRQTTGNPNKMAANLFGFPLGLDRMAINLFKKECHWKTWQRASIGIPNMFGIPVPTVFMGSAGGVVQRKCYSRSDILAVPHLPSNLTQCRQPSPMSNASRMLQMLDLVSLACLAGWWAVRYET